MQDHDVGKIEEKISEVKSLIKSLDERIAMVERDLVRIYELQELLKKCVEAGDSG